MKPTCISSMIAGLAWILTTSAHAAPPPTAFQVIGEIDAFTVATPANPLSAATITVHGMQIDIPANLIIQMPASYLTPSDIVSLNPTHVAGETGLAKSDTKPPLVSFEATVIGNIVGGRHVAGLVYISQGFLTSGAGFITSINSITGTITIGSDPTVPAAATDAQVHLNDPDGRFGAKTTWDERFTADLGNPTIRAETGYPMCLPRSAADPECPESNRPKQGAAALGSFVMGSTDLPPTPAGAPSVPHCSACDQTKQAPFEVGDYVAYSGIYQEDAGGNRFIVAHTMVASVGIYTAPGVDPAYIVQDTSLVGTRGVTITNPTLPPQETQDRFKLEGMTTDPSRAIDIYAIDVDTAGAKTLRSLATVSSIKGPRGRFRQIVGKNAGVLFGPSGLMGATRELMVHVATGVSLDGTAVVEPPDPPNPGDPQPAGTAANGLIAGQYVAPVGEYIFPESLVPGMVNLPNNFECLSFLQLGSGPLATIPHLPGPEPAVGRLAPWPGGPSATTALFCGP